jgi:hypothetical protein
MRDQGAFSAVAGAFEVGIDVTTTKWPGELYIVTGPDQRILVTSEALNRIIRHPELVHPGVTVKWQPFKPCPAAGCCQQAGFIALRGNNCYYGALLIFDTTSGRIVYQIGVFDLQRNAWWAQWPD